ncbi:hypothetical protein EYC84_001835 [Monilinia fructicola]|uniref:Uncharacterized protein n=1 Tax=Monilinia fructicola TaxID=38448 RepID=A0A5M9JRI2_MONFR|nr:hypothetical protein EYC84_001835 [Monilinia fructicola]
MNSQARKKDLLNVFVFCSSLRAPAYFFFSISKKAGARYTQTKQTTKRPGNERKIKLEQREMKNNQSSIKKLVFGVLRARVYIQPLCMS